MAKFKNPQLKPDEENELILDFCYVISHLPSLEKSVKFIRDLLSPREATMLAKRVKIARLLIKGMRYGDIQSALKVSSGTIARVHDWLKYSGDGYRESAFILEKRVKEKRKTNSSGLWKNLKRQYPISFWPFLLVEGIAESANRKEREKINSLLNQMWKKKEIFSEADRRTMENIRESIQKKLQKNQREHERQKRKTKIKKSGG